MAPKQKPLTVGKGTSYTRPKGDGKPPRPVSTKPSAAGRVRATQKTTSSGITRRPDGRPQTEGRRARQSTSTARVTSSSNGKPSGSGSARVTQGQGKTAAAANILKTASALMSVSKGGVKAAAVKEGLTARNTADGTLKGKSPANVKGPAVPARLTQGGLDKGSFDNAFRMSRKAGKSTFTWRGKKYNTKIRGEK